MCYWLPAVLHHHPNYRDIPVKPVSNYHPKYTKRGYSFREFGRKVKHIDESEAYEEDEAILLRNRDGKYTLLAATGCSCWDGDWEGWTNISVAELIKLGKAWAKDYGAAGTLGKWIETKIEEANASFNESTSRE